MVVSIVALCCYFHTPVIFLNVALLFFFGRTCFKYLTGGTKFVIGDKCQFKFALGYITALAFANSVRIIVWNTLALLARIEAEDTFGIFTCGDCSLLEMK